VPKDTVLRRNVAVPGVSKIPCGFVGDMVPDCARLASVPAIVSASFSMSKTVSSGGAGVPKKALFKARAANTGAGVSGGS
jgi:hypothetical protein